MRNETLKPLYWLWLPVIWIVFQLVAELTIPRPILEIVHDENGPHELVQFALLVWGFIIALLTLYTMDRKANYWLTGLMALAAFLLFLCRCRGNELGTDNSEMAHAGILGGC